jgi:integrase
MLVRVKGLRKHAGQWHYRRAVPARLRSIIGTPEAPKFSIQRSLGTDDLQVALRLMATAKADVDRIFAEAEAALKNPAARDYKVREAIQRSVRAALKEDAEDRINRPREPVTEEAEVIAITSALEKLKNAEGQEPATQRAILLALLKRVNGQLEDVSMEDNPPLSIVFDRWRAERQPPAKTWEEWSTARRRFETVIGGDLAVRGITKAHVRAFKDALLKMPARRRSDGEGKPLTLSPASVQKQLNAIKAVLSWAVAQGYMENNPATGISHARGSGIQGARTRRLPYEADDLRKLFGSAFSVKEGPDRWLPLLGLWTGARLEELGQLRTTDVGVEESVPYIHIRGGDGRRVKNLGSERRIPLHPELLRAGFLEYVEKRHAENQSRLFPELKPDRHGTLTRFWSKRFRYYAKSVGLTDPQKTFHSLRHGFKDACRRAGLSEEVHDALTGHKNGSVGRSYGTGVPLKVLAESMAKVRYAGLDLK